MSTKDTNRFQQPSSYTAVTAVTAVRSTKTTAVTAVLRERYQKQTGRRFKPIGDKAIDLLIEEYSDLTKTGSKDMSGYYARIIRIIGDMRFRELASRARTDGREGTKPGYFSWLLKHEVGPIKAS